MASPIAIPTRCSPNAAPIAKPSPPESVPWGQCSARRTQPMACRARPLTHPDSGYGTGNNTSFVSLSDKAKELSDDEGVARSTVRSVPLPGREELQLYRTSMDETTNARFREIAPEIQRRLQKNTQKGLFQSSKARSARQLTMSMRLMMVGTAAGTAAPSIVIFLPGEGASRLEAELEQPFLRSLYQPDDGITPSFNVFVVSQAPRKRLCRDVQVIWDGSRCGDRDLTTYCGIRISLQPAEGTPVMATLGGVVKLTYGPRNFKLVGMTAAHPLEELLDQESVGILGDDFPQGTKAKSAGDENDRGFAYPRAVGTVLYPRLDHDTMLDHSGDNLIPTCDWALFEIDPAVKIRPNLIHQVGATASYRHRTANSGMVNGCALTTAPPESFPSVEPLEVALLGGSSHFSGTMLGHLSHMPGGIMLSPEQGFVDAHLLTLDEGQALQDGDSGSWVVNPISLEVYGHVVATDMTGDAYVIPLHRSFDEMKEILGVESVDLPETADLLESALRAPQAEEWTMAVEDNQRERRASEVFLLCGGWISQHLRNMSVFDDGDSGYGSLGSALSTPFCAVAEVEEKERGTELANW